MSATRFTEICHVGQTGSTNADLLDEARRGGKRPLVLVTDHQTAGRGRQNRSWFDRPGDSLLVSVLFGGRQPWAQLIPLATGLAAREAIRDVLGLASPAAGIEGRPDHPAGDVVGLKWPNDVIVPALGERKLAGILVELLSLPTANAPASAGVSRPGAAELAIVIGMGLNLRWSMAPPPEVSERATTLTELWHHHRGNAEPPRELRNALLARYLIALDHLLDVAAGSVHHRGRAGAEESPILDRYRSACLTLGKRVAFETGVEVVEGTAVDIGSGGELVIEEADGNRRMLLSGDAHHLSSEP